MKIPLQTLYSLWDSFGDIPVDDDENIEEEFLGFPIGTHRYEIWHWFERSNSNFIAGEVMSGIRRIK